MSMEVSCASFFLEFSTCYYAYVGAHITLEWGCGPWLTITNIAKAETATPPVARNAVPNSEHMKLDDGRRRVLTHLAIQ